MLFRFLGVSLLAGTIWSCNYSGNRELAVQSGNLSETSSASRALSEEFKSYWFSGAGEITSYKLTQERYGELREGTAATIFVTEDFLPKVQVKANRTSKTTIQVMKLNIVKKYHTGIYPYSVMTSVFNPIGEKIHSVKITHSMQEWCGQVYLQLNNRKKYEIMAHSYFEGEADQEFDLPKTWLESELWNRIRINPEELPTGDFSILPSFEYFRMSHQKIASHKAFGNLVKGDSISTYTLSYPDLKRKLKIYFDSDFPFTIERWEETHANGLTSTAEKMKRTKTAYWSQNSNSDGFLRDSLGL